MDNGRKEGEAYILANDGWLAVSQGLVVSLLFIFGCLGVVVLFSA